MIRHGVLVSTDIHWPLPPKDPAQCLVTWEVEGGGLMGNLLTDTASVELSLWPETKYHLQVTCKNKVTETISRSLPFTLDTSSAVLSTSSTTASPSRTFIEQIESTSTINKIPDEITYNDIDNSDNNINNNKMNHQHTNDINEAIQLHLNHNKQKLSVWQKLLLNRNEIVIGVCASIVVFTVITIIIYLTKQNYFYYYSKLNICKTKNLSSAGDKEKLIENNSCSNYNNISSRNNSNNNNNNLKHINSNSCKTNSHNNSNNYCNQSNRPVYCDLQTQTIHV